MDADVSTQRPSAAMIWTPEQTRICLDPRRRIAQLETELAVTRRAVELVRQAVPSMTARGDRSNGREGLPITVG
ncbi:hypothetical protein ETD83_09230 [Actinomadura soli]|uniref:Uncharacterized protein n=1 Tax=Actinomadura soli TaxID=2508997 RepID=A0A5C4JGR6_9ACTN|nr:hypothetical protein [Actinomadura soli]TMR04168.1 hypothetical protein ETD83_09230 [Actinomadura soli]